MSTLDPARAALSSDYPSPDEYRGAIVLRAGRVINIPAAINSYESSLWAARRTKISSPDPSLLTISAAYPTPPLPPFLHPPIELASFGPRGHLDLDRRIGFSAICLGKLLHALVAEIHI